jgi:thioredoxin 1
MQKRVLNIGTPTCSGCKSIAPFLESIARRFAVEVVKINLEEQPDAAAQHGISSIPTLIYLQVADGQTTEVGRSVGFSPTMLNELQQFAAG